MEMSEQYPEYKDSIIFITNANRFRIFRAKGRSVNEIEEFENDDYDDLVRELNEEASKFIANNPEVSFIITAPEILKGDLQDKLDNEVLIRMTEVISKNLVALDIDAIVRILQEGK